LNKKDIFIKFQNATTIYRGDVPEDNKYCISLNGKKRYVIPLTKFDNKVYRINEISKLAKQDIAEYFNFKESKYTGFEFDFKPYKKWVKTLYCYKYKVFYDYNNLCKICLKKEKC